MKSFADANPSAKTKPKSMSCYLKPPSRHCVPRVPLRYRNIGSLPLVPGKTQNSKLFVDNKPTNATACNNEAMRGLPSPYSSRPVSSRLELPGYFSFSGTPTDKENRLK